ncbi:Histidine--tRNA ligase [bacterium HR17]|jgi:histidyl-tRNA synthetase|uniref:Histidine--tRNA ligase n=1 Tax=Candidatus Fervidibacter japonicus TaxID=2035412 RepID=A0A2H5XCS1_9BACT|nr:Histidine--tRNA ligase [bacterium HR17]
MATKFKAPRGTKDILPDEIAAWRFVEETFRALCACYGYREIRTPTFEDIGLFERTAGVTSDIVQKQMFAVLPYGVRHPASADERWVLRPEGTAPVARAVLEHGLLQQTPLVKVFYIAPIFRYERPQAGRLRQHHQCGVEAIGSSDPALDAEVIALGTAFLTQVGADRFTVQLNSIGCLNPDCRPRYREALFAFLRDHESALCTDCQRRMTQNPLRVLDCKEERCQAIVAQAPVTLDYLCADCRTHFDQVRRWLDKLGIAYALNGRLVRGLDYYTRTVFEFVHPDLGAQSTVLAGGRYDGLIAALGGEPTPGVGFGCGVERTLLARYANGRTLPSEPVIDAFVAVAAPEARGTAIALLFALRQAGVRADTDFLGRSLKAQMRFADKLGARFVLIVGDEEVRENTVTVRDMRQSEQWREPLPQVVDRIKWALQGQR